MEQITTQITDNLDLTQLYRQRKGSTGRLKMNDAEKRKFETTLIRISAMMQKRKRSMELWEELPHRPRLKAKCKKRPERILKTIQTLRVLLSEAYY